MYSDPYGGTRYMIESYFPYRGPKPYISCTQHDCGLEPTVIPHMHDLRELNDCDLEKFQIGLIAGHHNLSTLCQCFRS